MGFEWVDRDVWVTLGSLWYLSLIHTPESLPHLILTSKKGPALPPHYELKPYFLLWQNPNSWGEGSLKGGPELVPTPDPSLGSTHPGHVCIFLWV